MKSTDPVLAWGEWKNNAEMIADVAKLGYLKGKVLDPTWGEGNFWTVWRPRKRDFTMHDLYTLDGVDIRDLPHRHSSFDAVVIDLPYAFRGTATKEFDGKYGVDTYTSVRERMRLMFDGMDECWRVLRDDGFLMIKCQDQIVSGAMYFQTDALTIHAHSLGMRKVCAFHLRTNVRKQPERWKKCHNCGGHGAEVNHQRILGDCTVCNNTGRLKSTQQHPANNASTLLVFTPR